MTRSIWGRAVSNFAWAEISAAVVRQATDMVVSSCWGPPPLGTVHARTVPEGTHGKGPAGPPTRGAQLVYASTSLELSDRPFVVSPGGGQIGRLSLMQ